MRLLVIGGAGYIGSHMVQEILGNGHNPLNYDNLSTGLGWAAPDERLGHGDLADGFALSRFLSKFG